MDTQVTITHEEPGMKVKAELPKAWQATNSNPVSTITFTFGKDALTWEDDPVLAELWDNAEDAAAFNDDRV